MKTKQFLELYFEARTRFSNQLENLRTEDLKKKLEEVGAEIELK